MTTNKACSSVRLGLIAACWLCVSGCFAHAEHDYRHDGYYDDHRGWHGGYYDEDRRYHEDPADWHK